jgi:NAD(P)-dependent dehydrogenase (short-subunit alcohol dehydrogenase family)
VAEEDAADTAMQAAVGAFGRLDVVVNNAGYGDVVESLRPTIAMQPLLSRVGDLHPVDEEA